MAGNPLEILELFQNHRVTLRERAGCLGYVDRISYVYCSIPPLHVGESEIKTVFNLVDVGISQTRCHSGLKNGVPPAAELTKGELHPPNSCCTPKRLRRYSRCVREQDNLLPCIIHIATRKCTGSAVIRL